MLSMWFQYNNINNNNNNDDISSSIHNPRRGHHYGRITYPEEQGKESLKSIRQHRQQQQWHHRQQQKYHRGGGGIWMKYTCLSPFSRRKTNVNKADDEHEPTMIKVMYWNQTAATSDDTTKSKKNSDPSSSFLYYFYEKSPKILNRIDTAISSGGHNCPFDTFLNEKYCQERPKTTICLYPTCVMKIVRNRLDWLTELYMFNLLNDSKYFPKLIYHTNDQEVERDDILNEYEILKKINSRNDLDYNRTKYDNNNDGSGIRIDRNRKECMTMIIENVRPLGKCQNEWLPYTSNSQHYYSSLLYNVFDTYFTPNHIYPNDLKERNLIVHKDQLKIIDFGLYEIRDDKKYLEEQNEKLLSRLLNSITPSKRRDGSRFWAK